MRDDTKQIFFTADARLQLKRMKFDAAGVAVESCDDDAPVWLTGYALVWNQLSNLRRKLDPKTGKIVTYQVRLLPGSATFATPTIALYEHEAARLIGNTENATLRIMPADDIGVPVQICLPDTTTGRDVAQLVEDKYLKGMSFDMIAGFEDSVETVENGVRVLTAKKYTVGEVTVCAKPAFTTATIAIADGVEDVPMPAPVAEPNAPVQLPPEAVPVQLSAKQRLARHRLTLLTPNA